MSSVHMCKHIESLFQLAIEVAPPFDLPWPAPLDEGVSEDVYNTYIATPPPTAQVNNSNMMSPCPPPPAPRELFTVFTFTMISHHTKSLPHYGITLNLCFNFARSYDLFTIIINDIFTKYNYNACVQD